MMPRMPPEQPAASSQCLGFPSFDPRPAGRRVALYALLPAVIWLVALSSFAFFGPGLTSDFRAHIGFALAMFCAIILVPLALVALTLNWVVRRVAARPAAADSTTLRSSNRLSSSCRSGSDSKVQSSTSGSSRFHSWRGLIRVPPLGRASTRPFAARMRTASR